MCKPSGYICKLLGSSCVNRSVIIAQTIKKRVRWARASYTARKVTSWRHYRLAKPADDRAGAAVADHNWKAPEKLCRLEKREGGNCSFKSVLCWQNGVASSHTSALNWGRKGGHSYESKALFVKGVPRFLSLSEGTSRERVSFWLQWESFSSFEEGRRLTMCRGSRPFH